MNRLKQKLALLNKAGGKKPAAKRPSHNSTTHKMSLILGGDLVETARGPIFILRKEYPLQQRYGHSRLKPSLNFCAKPFSSLYTGLEHFCIKNSLFFDTETTGLAGGSGTYAFLVGIGFFEEDKFVTEQLLMRDHSDEPALLAHLAKRLALRDSLVSFNGRTFDAQLLATRFMMHRQREPFSEKSHLDLLHLSRRLFSHGHLPDCRLETIEHHILGAPRHQDVPGWMIPDIFFQFLRDKNPAPLKGVIEHNGRDLLAMVALCSHLQDLFQQEQANCPHINFGLAKLWADLGDFEKSDPLFKACLKNSELKDETRERALLVWARFLKKRKNLRSAALLWRRTLSHYPSNLEATVELAKWLEHQERDYYSALILVEGGLRDRSLTSTRRKKLEHRAHRLRRRVDQAVSS